EDLSIVRHAAWGSRLQARAHPLTPINGETAEQGILCVFGELCIDRCPRSERHDRTQRTSRLPSRSSVNRQRAKVGQARIDRHSIDLETSNAICPADHG